MNTITPFPEVADAISNIPVQRAWTLPIKPDVQRLSEDLQIVETVEQGEALMAQLNRLPLGAIAIDTEFGFTSRPIDLGGGRDWQDPRTLQPLLLSGPVWLPNDNRMIRFVFDLRCSELLPNV